MATLTTKNGNNYDVSNDTLLAMQKQLQYVLDTEGKCPAHKPTKVQDDRDCMWNTYLTSKGFRVVLIIDCEGVRDNVVLSIEDIEGLL